MRRFDNIGRAKEWTTTMLSDIRKNFREIIVPFDDIGRCFAGLQFDNCLDAGSGTGVFLEHFHASHIIRKGVGVEIDEKYFRSLNRDIVIKGEDGIGNQKFGLILFNDVLHHVREKREFLDHYIQTYLGDDGYVFIKEMNDRNIFCKYFNRLHDLIFARQIISEISPEKLKSCFSNYRLIAGGAKRFFLYDHYWMLFKKQ